MRSKYGLPVAAGQCSRLTGLPAPDGAYSRLWSAIAAGRLPAERRGGRWLIDEEHLPLAAEILGMRPTAEPRRSRPETRKTRRALSGQGPGVGGSSAVQSKMHPPYSTAAHRAHRSATHVAVNDGAELSRRVRSAAC